MALFVLGDTHLSLGGSKPMDVFGGAWVDYVDKLRAGFQVVEETDTVVLCGDISWGMSLPEAKPDFQFLQELLPGRKILLKGNHDYWWETVSKMTRFFEAEGLENFEFLHNNCLHTPCQCYRDIALCGTRGWFLDVEKGPHNEKMLRREVMRLEASLKAAGDREKICFLHYPPLYQGYHCQEITELLTRYQVQRCYYGHLHGRSTRAAFEGDYQGTAFSLVSADHLNFVPKQILA